MTIKPVSPATLDGVVEMYRALFIYVKGLGKDPYTDCPPPEKEDLRAQLAQAIDHPQAKIFVALDEGGRPVAFIAAELRNNALPTPGYEKVGYIAAAYVEEGYRNKGVMAALEKEAEGFFREKGVRSVELHALVSNEEAIRAWERMGYKLYRAQFRKMLQGASNVYR